jgi:peptide/nickel transport system substrate-binding protein
MTRRNGTKVWTLLPLAAMVVVLGVLAAGCGGSDDDGAAAGEAAEGDPNATVNVRIVGDYDSLNPVVAVSYAASMLTNFLFDKLVAVDSEGAVQPYLAESWEETDAGVVFTLKTGATCADGTKVTPSLVKASLDYLLDPESGSPYKGLIFGPAGATVTADDGAHTVTVTQDTPFADMIQGLAQPAASIFCGSTDPEQLKTTVNGSGPYTLETSARGDSYTLKKREGYTWGANGATTEELPATVVVKVVGNDTTAANLITSGGLNVAQVSGRDIERLRKDDGLFHTRSATYGTDPLIVNPNKGLPGEDPLVRKAVFHAIDAEALNSAMTFGNAKVVTTPLSSNQRCYDESVGEAGFGYDMDAARAALVEAGYVRGGDGIYAKDGKPLTLRVAGSSTQNSGPEYIRSQLEELGAKAELSASDHATFINTMYVSAQWDVMSWPLAFTYPSPWEVGYQLSTAGPPNGINVGFVNNAKANELVMQAVAAPEGEDCELYNQAEREWLQAADVKPINEHSYDWFGQGAEFEIDLGTLIDPFSLRAVK